VVYLVVTRRLFGVRGGKHAYEARLRSESIMDAAINAASAEPDPAVGPAPPAPGTAPAAPGIAPAAPTTEPDTQAPGPPPAPTTARDTPAPGPVSGAAQDPAAKTGTDPARTAP
jgi:hypothetical protein